MSKVLETRVMEEVMDVSKKGSGHVFFVQVREAVALPMTSEVVLAFLRIFLVSRRGSASSEWTLRCDNLTLLDVVYKFQPEYGGMQRVVIAIKMACLAGLGSRFGRR